MKNATTYQSRRERIRLSKNEQKISQAIAFPLALLLMIVFHLFRIVTKVLFKTKRYVGRISIACFMIYNAYTALSIAAYAPKPAQALNGIKHAYAAPSLNPNLTEREQNIALIEKIWGKDASVGLAIAKCESGYRTQATNYNTNYTVDQGIFQMNSVHDMPEMDTAVANIATAYLMYQSQGTTPWDSSSACWRGQI